MHLSRPGQAIESYTIFADLLRAGIFTISKDYFFSVISSIDQQLKSECNIIDNSDTSSICQCFVKFLEFAAFNKLRRSGEFRLNLTF